MLNFTQIFQDSWHFVQNQKRTVLFLFGIQFLCSILLGLVGSEILTPTSSLDNPSGMLAQLNNDNFLFFFLVREIIFLFLANWSLMIIHHISQQQMLSYSQSAVQTGKNFGGVVILNILIVFPILVGVYFALSSVLIGQLSESSAMGALLLMAVGVVIYIRLNLVPLHYLILSQPLSTTLRKIWQAGKGRNLELLIYAFLIYVAQPMVAQQLAKLSVNFAFNLASLAITTALNVFLLIFTYRFYTLFIQKAS